MENIKQQFARLYMELDLTDDQAAMIHKLQKDVNAALGLAHVSVMFCQCEEQENINDSIIGVDTCIKCDKPIDRQN